MVACDKGISVLISVIIGNSPTYGGMYQSVRVIIDANLPPGESANRAQAMLLAIGVGPALHPQSADDLEKIKIAKIFRAYDPGNANQMERSKEFYGLSSQDLKQLIIMTSNFTLYEASEGDNACGIGFWARDAMKNEKACSQTERKHDLEQGFEFSQSFGFSIVKNKHSHWEAFRQP